MDPTALMYRFKFFESDPAVTRKERKLAANKIFGKASKRGQLLPGDPRESRESASLN